MSVGNYILASLIRIVIWFIQHNSEKNREFLASLCKKTLVVLIVDAWIFPSFRSILSAALLGPTLFTLIWWLLS